MDSGNKNSSYISLVLIANYLEDINFDGSEEKPAKSHLKSQFLTHLKVDFDF